MRISFLNTAYLSETVQAPPQSLFEQVKRGQVRPRVNILLS